MKIIFTILLLFIVVGCGKKNEAGPDLLVPKIAALVSPLQDEICITGEVISDRESNITFVWKPAEYAKTYELNYKNLENGNVGRIATEDTKITIKLLRNTPYSWKVISKSSTTQEVSTSETWKFYNAGFGAIAYAPYPSELVSPLTGTKVAPVAGKVTLTWKGADPDGDITSYSVYFGPDSNPPLLKSDFTSTQIDVTVSPATTYYWKIVAKDSKGNLSNSDVGQFKTN